MRDLPDTLSEATELYLRSSPKLKYPLALVSQFPRIANALFLLKDEPEKLRNYFNSLDIDMRGNRKGFSFEVWLEIHQLREFMIGDVDASELGGWTNWVP